MEPAAKKAKTTMSGKTIGTHNGSFHADEALAIVLLKKLPEYTDWTIVRTRDPKVIDTCDIVVDVGGVFDHSKFRYDHHQRGFAETMNSLDASKPWTTKLSSAGLVYQHYGRRVISQVLGLEEGDATIEILFDKMYANFIEEYDGKDNGVNQYDGEALYTVNSTVGQRVARLAPSWNESSTGADFDTQFGKAMALVDEEFLQALNSLYKSWLPARDIVKAALASRMENDPSGDIMVLPQFCPWKSHIYELEKELSTESAPIAIKYVLYEDSSGKWRIQCVSVNPASFENRLSLPEPWQGVRDEKLSELSGIPGCIFVHANGFIGGNMTKEGVMAMAQASLTFKK